MNPIKDWTWEDLAWKIDSEGFDYFFTNWLSMDEIKDKKLKDLAKKYKDAAWALEEYLRQNGGML